MTLNASASANPLQPDTAFGVTGTVDAGAVSARWTHGAEVVQPLIGLRVGEVRPLVSAAVLMRDAPITSRAAALVSTTRAAIADVLSGMDDRLIVIVGPCSIDDTPAALEFGRRLKVLADRHADHLIVVMRTYLEKARTSVGWKGLINDPDLDHSCHVNKALNLARQLLLALNENGVPTGTEFLDMHFAPHILDLVSWASIGARTVESPIHRQLASGLPMPVGFKNRRDGSIEAAIDALQTARAPHWIPIVSDDGNSALVRTTGNDSGHVVLRGGVHSGPNYAPEHVAHACAQLASRGLAERVMIDCSHDNSCKNHIRQLTVAAAVSEQVASETGHIVGTMLESYLVEGRQEFLAGRERVYGQSITDSCLSLEQTSPLLDLLARAQHIRHKRNRDGRDRHSRAVATPRTYSSKGAFHE